MSIRNLIGLAMIVLPGLAAAQSCLPVCSILFKQPEEKLPPAGFLCCNMRTDGGWISDSNYIESGQYVVPLGTPVKPTGYGRYRLNVDIGGNSQSIGNDYSRNMSMEEFGKRYVVPDDPKAKLHTYSDKMRAAITSAKILPGMTREQVLMSIGYPVANETPDIKASSWRYWLTSSHGYLVKFDEMGNVTDVVGEPFVKAQVLYH